MVRFLDQEVVLYKSVIFTSNKWVIAKIINEAAEPNDVSNYKYYDIEYIDPQTNTRVGNTVSRRSLLKLKKIGKLLYEL